MGPSARPFGAAAAREDGLAPTATRASFPAGPPKEETMTESSGRRDRDLAGRRLSFGLVWGLPIAAVILAGFAGPAVKTITWTVSLSWMALMMLGLSVLMVFSKQLVERILPRRMRAIRWLAGVGVMAAGAYLIYYNLFFSELIVL